jgi:hypothetical protein
LSVETVSVAVYDAKIDNPPMMLVFALDGKAELPTPAPPPPNNNNRPPTAPGAAPELQQRSIRNCSKAI